MSVCGTTAPNCEDTGTDLTHVVLRNVTATRQPFHAVLQKKRRPVSQEDGDVLVIAPYGVQTFNIELLIPVSNQSYMYIYIYTRIKERYMTLHLD